MPIESGPTAVAPTPPTAHSTQIRENHSMKIHSLALVLSSLAFVSIGSDAIARPAGGSGCETFADLGNGLAGVSGVPLLTGHGPLHPEAPVEFQLSNAAPSALVGVLYGSSQLNTPFKGGTLVPSPDNLTLAFTNVSGGLLASGALPASTAAGTDLAMQMWIADVAGPQGYSASNAIAGTTLDTLFNEMSASFDARLVGAGPASTALPIYSTQDFANKTFVRNPSCWARDLDLTGISPWNQAYVNLRAGTLVSPRHIVFAEHFRLSTTPGNNDIVFVTDNNVTITRQIISAAYPVSDIGVALLDSDVPPEITHYRVLPQDWRDYLKQTEDLPMLHLDQQEKAIVRDMRNLFPGVANMRHKTPTDATRLMYSEAIIGGDSGNPAFVVIGDEPVLVLTHFGSTLGPFYTHYRDLVNAAMTQLGGGYQLSEVDLSECVDW